MATYVCSDIHGMSDKYFKLIRTIDLKKEDTLIIGGDVVDRGKDGLEIIEHIRANDNIVLLLGNHEQMLIDYYRDNDDYNIWFGNGGLETFYKLEAKGYAYLFDLLQYLAHLPLVHIAEVCGEKYVIVHAGFSIFRDNMTIKEILKENDKDDFIWNRIFLHSYDIIEGHTAICGHTSTQSINGKAKIIHKEGKMAIDCGCCFEGGKLACIRLDDLKEFYI